jgi:transposase
LARTFYSMLKNGTEYVDHGKEYYEKQYANRVLKNIKKRAASLGFKLVQNIDQGDTNKDLAISAS